MDSRSHRVTGESKYRFLRIFWVEIEILHFLWKVVVFMFKTFASVYKIDLKHLTDGAKFLVDKVW